MPPCLWSSQVSACPPSLACPAQRSLCRGAAARRSSLLLVSPDDCSPADSPLGLFPLRSKGEVPDVLIPWIRAVRLQLHERFRTDLPVLRLHSDRGGEFSSDLLRDFCRGEGILQSFTLPASPQQNGVAERRIGLVMEIARTSMIHAAAPHFLWPFAVRYAAHQLNLWPRVSLPETSPTLLWTGEVGDASRFRVWGARAFVRDTTADKLSSRAVPCVFLGFPPDAPGWQFYHPTSRRVFASQDVTFDESVPFYRLFPYRTAPLPPPPLFLAPGPPPVDPLPPQGPAPSGVSQVDPLPLAEPVEVTGDSGAAGGGPARGAAPGGTEPERAEPRGAELERAEPGSAKPERAEPGGAEPERAEPESGEPGGAEPLRAEPEVAEPGGAASEGAEPGGAASRGAEPEGAEPGGAAYAGGPPIALVELEAQELEALTLGALELEVLELEVLALEVLELEALELEALEQGALELEALLLEVLELEVLELEALCSSDRFSCRRRSCPSFRPSRVPRNQHRHHPSSRLQSKPQRLHVEQQQILHLLIPFAAHNRCLNRRAIRDDLVGVDALAELLSVEVLLQQLLHLGNVSRPAD
ncbi:unnamed protein product [Closterium sp. Yama58-4]|nr:unnamed protein product [Closterium sp. Yama58-4]